jgi:hypothetical protein
LLSRLGIGCGSGAYADPDVLARLGLEVSVGNNPYLSPDDNVAEGRKAGRVQFGDGPGAAGDPPFERFMADLVEGLAYLAGFLEAAMTQNFDDLRVQRRLRHRVDVEMAQAVQEPEQRDRGRTFPARLKLPLGVLKALSEIVESTISLDGSDNVRQDLVQFIPHDVPDQLGYPGSAIGVGRVRDQAAIEWFSPIT